MKFNPYTNKKGMHPASPKILSAIDDLLPFIVNPLIERDRQGKSKVKTELKKKLLMWRIRDVLAQLQNNKCYWCGENMLGTQAKAEDGRDHPRARTYDHMFEKNHPMRNDFHGVAACYECNNMRSSSIAKKHQYWGA